MSCTTCNKVVVLGTPEIRLDYTTRTRFLMGRDGITYKITASVIAMGHKPRGGWGATLRINGQSHAILGETAREVFTKAKRLVELNDLRVSDLNLWFNLNIQWLQRATEKYQMVRLEDLLAAAIAEDEPELGTHETPKWSPSAWLGGVWDTLCIYLAGDTYEYQTFLSLLEVVKTMLDSVQSPVTGSAEAYQKFMLRMFSLKSDPVFTQHAARVWLHETLAGLSSSTMTFEELSLMNHWKI